MLKRAQFKKPMDTMYGYSSGSSHPYYADIRERMWGYGDLSLSNILYYNLEIQIRKELE
jgi:hypothetical protein